MDFAYLSHVPACVESTRDLHFFCSLRRKDFTFFPITSSRFDPGSSRKIISGECRKERMRPTLSLCHDEREDIF